MSLFNFMLCERVKVPVGLYRELLALAGVGSENRCGLRRDGIDEDRAEDTLCAARHVLENYEGRPRSLSPKKAKAAFERQLIKVRALRQHE